MPDWNSDVIPTDATLRGEGFDQQQVRMVDINIENLPHKMLPKPGCNGVKLFFARQKNQWILV